MPSPRRVFINNSAVFVTTRTEEGLPLVPTDFMNMIIWSALAKGQALHPDVAVCGFVFLPNHFHMLLVVEDPEQVSPYVGYVKQELAHAINRLLNRRQKTIWKAEFDAPPVLDSAKALEVLAYIYLNPVEAGLECSANDYPGVSSWGMLNSGRSTRWCEGISRDSINRLTTPARPDRHDRELCSYYRRASKASFRFNLKPFAWKKCFSDTSEMSDADLKACLLEKVANREAALAEERKKNRVTVLGRSALVCSSMLRTYTPKKYGKRMICLASCRELRVEYITFFRELCARASAVYAKWKQFDYSEAYPEQLFAPAFIRRMNVLGWRPPDELSSGERPADLYSMA